MKLRFVFLFAICLFQISGMQCSGIEPREEVYTITSSDLIVTIPKTGTNLLLKCLKLIKLKYDDSSLTSWRHQWRSDDADMESIGPTQSKIDFIEKNHMNLVLIIRDPRDLVTAIARSEKKTISSKLIDDIINFPGKHLSKVACNFPYFLKYSSFLEVYEEYLEWDQHPFVYIVRFEDLIGEKGGGSEDRQIQEILNIANHIGKPLSYEEARSVASELFGGTPTFKQGKIQDWKKHFSEENLKTFKLLNGDLLESIGYED